MLECGNDDMGMQDEKPLSVGEFEEIRSLYLSRLEIPEKKPPVQFLLCPVGLIGAGKTTVLVPLAKKLGTVRVSTDEIRKMLKEQGFNYDRSRDIAHSIATELLTGGHSIALDMNCGSRDGFPEIQKLIRRFAVKAFWLHINPPESFIVDKLRNFEHTWLFRNGDEAVAAYFRSKEKHGDMAKKIGTFTYAFDPSRDDLHEQIEECARLIEADLGSAAGSKKR